MTTSPIQQQLRKQTKISWSIWALQRKEVHLQEQQLRVLQQRQLLSTHMLDICLGLFFATMAVSVVIASIVCVGIFFDKIGMFDVVVHVYESLTKVSEACNRFIDVTFVLRDKLTRHITEPADWMWHWLTNHARMPSVLP